MFIRKNRNRSGSFSVQIITKASGKYKLIKTIGSGRTEQELQKLTNLARQELEPLSQQPKLFISEIDSIIEHVFSAMDNASIKTIIPELIFIQIDLVISIHQVSVSITG